MIFKNKKHQIPWDAVGEKLEKAHWLRKKPAKLWDRYEEDMTDAANRISRLEGAVQMHENNAKLRQYVLPLLYIAIWLTVVSPGLWLLWIVVQLLCVFLLL